MKLFNLLFIDFIFIYLQILVSIQFNLNLWILYPSLLTIIIKTFILHCVELIGTKDLFLFYLPHFYHQPI
ncbi:MAG: hypothetical protein EXX96DRAFT_578934, partial [Benjaminiella poitrasii]